MVHRSSANERGVSQQGKFNNRSNEHGASGVAVVVVVVAARPSAHSTPYVALFFSIKVADFGAVSLEDL